MNGIRAFTLVELLVVIIIIGILAAVTVPIMGNMQKRAIITEALAGLATIRTAERAYFLEHDRYRAVEQFINGSGLEGIQVGTTEDNSDGDLDGTYFSEECYSVLGVVGSDGAFVWIYCRTNVADNRAPRRDDVIGFIGDGCFIKMYTDGQIQTNIPGIGFDSALK